jgi:hypothetical protein
MIDCTGVGNGGSGSAGAESLSIDVGEAGETGGNVAGTHYWYFLHPTQCIKKS